MSGYSLRAISLSVCAITLLSLCSSCLKHVAALPPGPITISGEVNDATGLPLPNDNLILVRKHRYVEAKTDPTGHYAFPNLAAASYLLFPRLHGCRFLPPRADLDHLTASITEDFGGFGPACGGEAKVNEGAMNGPLTISGHIHDASGLPIVGARIELSEHTRAIRFTGLTGAYSFQVKPGDYHLQASGTCSFTPRRVHKDDLHANATQDFVAGPGCVTITASQSNVNPTGSVITIQSGANVLGKIYAHIEARSSPADALARIQQIIAEHPATPTRSLTIAGDAAIERQITLNLPGPGREPDIAGGGGSVTAPFIALTTAIVDGSTVVRFESQLPGTADAATINMFFETGRNFTPASMNDLHGPPNPTVPVTRNTPPSHPTVPGISAAGILAQQSNGELQVAASDTVNAVVYGTPNGPFLSVDGGQTIKPSVYNTAAAPPSATFNSLGDPTVAVGAPNASFQQAMYFAQLEQAAPIPAGGNVPIVAAGLYQSTDNGATFNFTFFPVNCSVAAGGCVVPDQEQLAADRINRAVNPTGTADQLYLAWRNFTAQNSGARTIAVACSSNGGLTWKTDLTTLATTGADFPRLAVGPDGTLLVAYKVGGSAYSLNIQTWTSCASGFKSGVPVTVVSSVTEVTDMPGLDRPPLGNYLPAFDDSDGSAQTIFMVYANEASTGNDDIHAIESKDGGNTWTRDSIVNTVGTGRRYFPWICSTLGKKFVTWYDRRNSTAAKPDLTAYYRSSVSDNGSATSIGIGAESNVSGVDDPQCAPGFPKLVRGGIEESGCNNLPPLPAGFIQGGTCQAACAPGVTGPCGTLAACDFRAATPCAGGQTCTAGLGFPKYGDYNGAGCSLGTLFVAWASATPPANASCFVNGTPAAAAARCCSGNLVGGICSPTAAACTPTGNACGGGAAACCSGVCQAGRCLPAISLYTGSSSIGPPPTGLPVTITYHQTGACNGYVDASGSHGNSPNAAFVIFGIERIDNSGGSTNFAFDPGNLFVQQAAPRFFDSGLSLYTAILGPFAISSQTLTPGQNRGFSPTAQGALAVTTTNADGSTEANSTRYFLQYNRQPTDPLIKLVKSDAARTSWPNTQDCTTIILK